MHGSEPTVLLVPITSRDVVHFQNTLKILIIYCTHKSTFIDLHQFSREKWISLFEVGSNAMLWRMLSRLETCIVYSCIWSVTLAKSIVPRKTWRKLSTLTFLSCIYLDFNLLLTNRNLSPITFRFPWWKNIENLTCIFVKNNLEM
jgi:hypothetical protein